MRLGTSIVAVVIFLTPTAHADVDSPEPEQCQLSELVSALDDTDVQWIVDEARHVKIVLRNEAAKLAAVDHPPITDLVRALKDSKRFVAAHVVLSKLQSKGGLCAFVVGPVGKDLLLEFSQLEVLVDGGPTSSARKVIKYPNKSLAQGIVTGLWKFVRIDDVKEHIRRISTRPTREKKLRLAGRRRDLVEQIQNGDVKWRPAGFASVKPELAGKTRDVTERAQLSIEGLLDALGDDERFVAAHIILSREFGQVTKCTQPKSDGFRVMYNGLRADLSVQFQRSETGKSYTTVITYPYAKEQKAKLVKHWKRLVVRWSGES